MNTPQQINNNVSAAQQLYMKQHKQHHHFVTLMRFLILISFLLLWEVAAQMNWIDPFFFSSPSNVFTYFISMLLDGSFFEHTGITLFETLVSFLLITIISLIFSVLHLQSQFLNTRMIHLQIYFLIRF